MDFYLEQVKAALSQVRACSVSMNLSCLVLGLLAGAMLVIGIAFVSFWKASHRATSRPGSRPIRTSSAA